MADRCRYCNAPIRWASHYRTGSPMPFDLKPLENEKWVLEKGGTGNPTAFPAGKGTGVLPGLEEDAKQLTYRPHWATCPRAKEARNET